MKVVKAAVLTEEISIKSTAKRRLAEGEVVEALSDDAEGWVTPEGNQGSVFLVEGGNVFKVVKETLLTGAFVIGEGEKDKDRKLKVGEILEIREWEKKEETSGLMRMKVCVKSDGQLGYATTVGNTGIKFLEVV